MNRGCNMRDPWSWSWGPHSRSSGVSGAAWQSGSISRGAVIIVSEVACGFSILNHLPLLSCTSAWQGSAIWSPNMVSC